LANDGGLGSLIVIETRVAGRGVIAAGDASRGDAAIRIRGEDTTSFVYRKVIEVQEVSGSIGAESALGADHAELHVIIGRGVHGEPGAAPVVSSGYVAVPHAVERSWSGVRACASASRRRAQEEEGRAVIVARDDFREHRIAHTEGRSNIQVIVPGASLVIGNGDVRMSIARNVAKIDSSFGANPDGRVARIGSASGYRLHREGESVIHGDDKTLGASAPFIGNVDDPAGADLM